jgi:hypothetical protein
MDELTGGVDIEPEVEERKIEAQPVKGVKFGENVVHEDKPVIE